MQIYLQDKSLKVELLCQSVCAFDMLVAVTKLLSREIILIYTLIAAYEGICFSILSPTRSIKLFSCCVCFQNNGCEHRIKGLPL